MPLEVQDGAAERPLLHLQLKTKSSGAVVEEEDAVDAAAEASNVAVQFKQLPVVSHPGVVGAEVVEVVPLR